LNELSAQFRRLEAQARRTQNGYENNPRAARVINAFESSMKQRGIWFFSDRNKRIGTGRFSLSNG
jgi:hypothetical protein